MGCFYFDLKYDQKISCDLESLKKKFPILESEYYHWIRDDMNSDLLGFDFINWLNQFGLIIRRIEIFHTDPMKVTGWHTDMNPPASFTKINWVFEDGISYMEWADLDNSQMLTSKKTMANTTYVSFDPEKTRAIERKHLVGPTLINVGYPHRIINQKETERWCVSCILWDKEKNQRVLWEDALRIFKDFIV